MPASLAPRQEQTDALIFRAVCGGFSAYIWHQTDLSAAGHHVLPDYCGLPRGRIDLVPLRNIIRCSDLASMPKRRFAIRLTHVRNSINSINMALEALHFGPNDVRFNNTCFPSTCSSSFRCLCYLSSFPRREKRAFFASRTAYNPSLGQLACLPQVAGISPVDFYSHFIINDIKLLTLGLGLKVHSLGPSIWRYL